MRPGSLIGFTLLLRIFYSSVNNCLLTFLFVCFLSKGRKTKGEKENEKRVADYCAFSDGREDGRNM